MAVQIKIPNVVSEDAVGGQNSSGRQVDGINVAVNYKSQYRIARNRAGGTEHDVDLLKDEIVEVEFNDGSVWFVDEKDLEELQRQKRTTGRGESGIVIDSALFQSSGTRGELGDIISVKKGTLPSLDQIQDQIAEWISTKGGKFAKRVGKDTLASIAAAGLGHWIDHQNDTKGVSSLCRVNTSTSVPKLITEPIDLKKQSDPWLLFIHGTFSSTTRAFGGIWNDSPASWQRLVSRYGDRIIALEHRTLTESPIQNALTALRGLPEEVNLHIVSHSRGGLVGELLCRGDRAEALDKNEMKLLKHSSNSSPGVIDFIKEIAGLLGYPQTDELEDANELNEQFRRKKIRVEKFVRVGCPARGTTLASDRSHRWLNRFLNVVGMIPALKISPMYAMIQSLLVGFVRSATNASVLPGLHAQSPQSGLIRVLNSSNSGQQLSADLSIVSGRVEASGWKRVPMWVADRFFGGNHDLVVNTASMDGGTPRKKDIVEYRTGSNHLEYFSDSAIVAAIEKRLTSPSNQLGVFEPKKQRFNVKIASRGKKSKNLSIENNPTLVLLPGIMGSTLKVNEAEVWVSYWRLLMGGLGQLKMSESGAFDVEANGLLEDAYAEFVEHFRASHHVVEFPYDWRKSLSDSAVELEKKLQNVLKQNRQQPIRIVAHSMGGLVVRRLMVDFPELWKEAMRHDGSRFIMAGTPNQGSFATLRTLVGQDRTIKSLALLDLRHSLNDLMNLVRKFPGLLSLLPVLDDQEWIQQNTWIEIQKVLKESNFELGWNAEDTANLARVRQDLGDLVDVRLDPQKVCYVAGIGEKTPSNATIEGNTIRFEYTEAGDGTVTWQSGIPNELSKVWYQASTHGSLLSERQYFEAWTDIVERGNTDRLFSRPRTFGSRGGQLDERFGELEPDNIDYLPTESEVARIAIGADVLDEGPRETVDLHPLGIEVAHGDLRFSTYPVAVGHYEGDSIIHAEKVLDENLRGRLSRRFNADRYPGPLNSCEVVISTAEGQLPEGALVIGLGRFGTLTGARLERTLAAAIKQYIIEWNELPVSHRGEEIGLSALIVGSGMGGLSLSDSLRYLVEAARTANSQIGTDRSMMLLRKIEILELWEDLAHEALHYLVRLRDDLNTKGVYVNCELQYRHGGRSRPFVSTDRNWWDTISVRKERDEFVFNSFTRFARNEVMRDPIKIKRVDQYIDRIINRTEFNRDERVGSHQTLFEIVLPNHIKDNSLDTDKLRMILDEDAARIPWEMLIDGWSDKPEPLCIKKQMVRQLNVESFVIAPERAEKNRVLVVGDPPGEPDFLPLPGARAEANAVAKFFDQKTDYDVVSVIRGARRDDKEIPNSILDSLMSQENKILHFAAHGIFDGSEPGKCGVVIGPDRELFTSDDVRKIRRVPDLVFLNCCHLGRTKDQLKKPKDVHRIAANLATTFIEIGVKAVIAAGWEVNDSAAQSFAIEFYRQFIAQRETFGNSVLAARRKIYDEMPLVNTFGAYQAWGDPDFSLRFSVNRNRQFKDRVYVSPQAFQIEAHNIRQTARAVTKNEIDRMCVESNELRSQLFDRFGSPFKSQTSSKGAKWNNPATKALVELARAYGELGSYDQAILLLHEARRLHVSALTFRDLEQLANFEGRYALEVLLSKSEVDVDNKLEYARALASHGISLLEEIVERQAIDSSSTTYKEIHCLIGSANRRMAVICVNSQLEKCLQNMRRYYGRAWLLPALPNGERFNEIDFEQFSLVTKLAHENEIEPIGYAFTNFLLGNAAKTWFDSKYTEIEVDAHVLELLRKHLENSKRREQRANYFWDAVGRCDLLLIQLVHPGVRGRVGEWNSEKDIFLEIRKLFRDTRRRFGSARQWLSIFDQVLFIRKMLEKANRPNDIALPFVRQIEVDLASHAGKDVQRPAPKDGFGVANANSSAIVGADKLILEYVKPKRRPIRKKK